MVSDRLLYCWWARNFLTSAVADWFRGGDASVRIASALVKFPGWQIT